MKPPGLRTVQKFLTGTHHNKQKICKKVNDPRGCDGSCKDLHVCDVVLEKSGQTCGSKSHFRAQQDAAKHGTPKPRP